jgi:palmitoyltransferase
MVLYGIITGACIVSGFIATISDPSDPLIKHPDEKKRDYYCHICQSYLSDEKSKHCGSCNRCCSGFDHHCKWLNNCVGDENYSKFIVFTCLSLLHCIFQLVVASMALQNV